MMPRYPVYIPTKGRYKTPFTIRMFQADHVPIKVVVEPTEVQKYEPLMTDRDELLVLPWSGDDKARRAFCKKRKIENGGIVAARNWIREHSESAGDKRHWQFDDNIDLMRRRVHGGGIPVHSGTALRIAEDFTDRYTNIAISGVSYEMFNIVSSMSPPFLLNVHVYSMSLILNEMPFRWRLAYNEDTDICLQALSNGWCTVLFQAIMGHKMKTMKCKGGNTDDLYQGDGRAVMSRSLERMWPYVVGTKRRYHRPAHVVRRAWRMFDAPLKRRDDIDWDALSKQGANEYGLELKHVQGEGTHPVIKSILKADKKRRKAKAKHGT